MLITNNKNFLDEFEFFTLSKIDDKVLKAQKNTLNISDIFGELDVEPKVKEIIKKVIDLRADKFLDYTENDIIKNNEREISSIENKKIYDKWGLILWLNLS